MIKVGIVGGTGYTGIELLRLLSQHPQIFRANQRAIPSQYEDVARPFFKFLFAHPNGVAGTQLIFLFNPVNSPVVHKLRLHLFLAESDHDNGALAARSEACFEHIMQQRLAAHLM